jgi:hypothetical protein
MLKSLLHRYAGMLQYVSYGSSCSCDCAAMFPCLWNLCACASVLVSAWHCKYIKGCQLLYHTHRTWINICAFWWLTKQRPAQSESSSREALWYLQWDVPSLTDSAWLDGRCFWHGKWFALHFLGPSEIVAWSLLRSTDLQTNGREVPYFLAGAPTKGRQPEKPLCYMMCYYNLLFNSSVFSDSVHLTYPCQLDVHVEHLSWISRAAWCDC